MDTTPPQTRNPSRWWGLKLVCGDRYRGGKGPVPEAVRQRNGGVAPGCDAWYVDHDHVEAIEIVFDPERISYRDLLEYFFQIHDPTVKDRQGNEVGACVRSEIFYTSDDQRRVAEETIAEVDGSGLWPGKVVTEVRDAGPFWEAEPALCRPAFSLDRQPERDLRLHEY
jgi:peptide-methionine (S)-S-oxide reductase